MNFAQIDTFATGQVSGLNVANLLFPHPSTVPETPVHEPTIDIRVNTAWTYVIYVLFYMLLVHVPGGGYTPLGEKQIRNVQPQD